ncbi:MAG: thioester reductase domain-containing protein, partial [Chlamydiia bacterium]|nr:thioester reductase domain-containing protein [Chlamydiia bacterium]
HLVVYIEQKEGEKVSIEEVRDYASTKLPKHALPSYFVFMEQFPLTPNGKIDRRNLPAPTQTLEERRFDPPKTQTEKKLAKLWATLLKVPRVGREDNFFHIGGHSILAMQLNSQVKRDFKHPIPVNLIFQKSTLRSYAEGIDQILAHGVEAVFSKKSFDLWRRDEVTLDPTIKGEGAIGATKEQYTHPKNIFLTGATGFIGAFFLKDLIEKTEATIHALCRAKDSKEGMERLMKTLKKYHIWKREYKSRIKAVPGALDVPLLGLQPKAFETLGSEIDSIFHFGAFVNHAMSYQEHRGANVVGVQEILRLSSTHRLKPLHFISTVAVLEGITEQPAPEDAEIDQSIGLTNGYVESKWVGEKIIHLAQSRGIPCTILRLPRVSGDSESGSGPEGDFLWRVVQASLLLKMAPDVDLYDDLTPVDFICAAILEISKKEEWINHPFHVISPDHLLYKDVFMWLKELGYPLKIVSFAKWKKTLVEEAIKTGDARLQALASLMADFDLSKPTQIQKLSFKNLKAALKERGIECPRIDQELFKRYVDYYIKTGFLPKPRV